MFQLLDLFSGIGGFSIGLERSGGFKTVAFCEIEPFCRAVLKKHWPEVPCYDDVRTLTAEKLAADGIAVDAICGGFPCQDISVAGKGAGIEGERSGLWSEYARIIGEIRPRFVIVENVAALLGRGLDRVLGDLAALGFDAEWHCIPASAVGAPHRRDRLWIVAYPTNGTKQNKSEGVNAKRSLVGTVTGTSDRNISWDTAARIQVLDRNSISTNVSDSDRSRLPPSWPQPIRTHWRNARGVFAASDWWRVEPDVGRMANGVPARVDRIKALGNSVVPQIPEIIGRAILASEAQ